MADENDGAVAAAEAAEQAGEAAEAAAEAAEAAAEASTETPSSEPAAVVVGTNGNGPSGTEEVSDALSLADQIRGIVREEVGRVQSDLYQYVDSRVSNAEEAAQGAAETAAVAAEAAIEAAEEVVTAEEDTADEPPPEADEAPRPRSRFCEWWYGKSTT